MISSLLLVKIFVAVASVGGGYLVVKRVTQTETDKQLKLENKMQKHLTREERVELESNRDLIILKLKKYSLDSEFSDRLTQVHEIFEQKNYQHPRAHTFYNLLLPKLLAVKKANKELSSMTERDVNTNEMYASLNAWMDDIIAHKIDGLEGEAEINAEVITLLTK